ncbi:Lipase 1 [Cyphellophora attinorum]|uniref:Lipase 1 n=1 Tax=Cyphellophora attinorum TaxID=1664694 RepID=A0A0N0NPR6_9EURO|nr:Lipase 1 [Phialophora attinorum]KPI43061.1 Lipase 1 [Phialophora attinorum]
MHQPIPTTFALLGLLFSSAAALTYAALGDSYPAGDGAGHALLPPDHPDFGCGRFTSAYPVLLSQTPELNINPSSDFLNLPCGGASTSSVRRTQLPLLLRGSDGWDVLTLTVGGNEVGFFEVLNACVYRFFPVLPGRGCVAELERARSLVEDGGGKGLLKGVGELVRELAGYKDEVGGRLLVTGYARFFNEDTEWCDGVSFAGAGWEELFLTRAMRREFNEVVRLLNDIIRANAEVHGAEYVDIDAVFEGHRFCEEGGWEALISDETWFFGAPEQEQRSSTTVDINGKRRQETVLRLPRPIGGFVNMTRAFHPTVLGHEAVAKQIADMLLSISE